MSRPASPYDRALVESALDVRGKDTGGGRRRAPCPLCERVRGKADAKLSVYQHADGGWVCFRCGVTGWLPWATPSLRRPRAESTITLDAEGAPWRRPPTGFVPIYDLPALDDPAFDLHRAYVEHRGVDAAVARALFLGGCPSGFLADHIVVPVLDDSTSPPTWNGWVARVLYPSGDPGDPIYREPAGAPKGTYLYRQSVLRQPSDVPALIVEGVFDTMPLHPNAAATLSKMSPALFRLIVAECRASGRPVVFVPDGDAWRDGDAYAQAARAAGVQSGCVRLPPRVDPDEIPPEVTEAAAVESLTARFPVLVGDHDL